jgi:hypothetical protein
VTKPSLSIAAVIVIGISLIIVGGTSLGVPGFAADMYGVSASDATVRAYVWATGIRDVAIGCWLLVLVAIRAGARVLGISITVISLIPIGDAINVWINTRTRSSLALVLHISSVFVFVALGLWILRQPSQK